MAPKQAFQEHEEFEMEDPENPEGEEDEYDEEEEEDFEGIDLSSILAPFLTTEEGDSICTALVNIGTHMEKMTKLMDIQNKIMIKMLSQMNKKEEA
jgi:hypothetical protein